MSERYAIYFAPAPGTPVSQLGCSWLGRDGSGEPVRGLSDEERALVDRNSRDARRYGFHATLKAPMKLGSGTAPETLIAALRAFAATESAVDLGPLQLNDADHFLALVPTAQAAALTQFAARCVEAFEPFRAPLTPSERQRRTAKGLSARQLELLDHYGYPHVLDQFAFHMTLSDRLDPKAAAMLKPLARHHFAPMANVPQVLDRLALFHESRSGAPLTEIAAFPLRAR